MRFGLATFVLFLAIAGIARAGTNLVGPVQTYACASHTWANALASGTGATTCVQPAYPDISGGIDPAIAQVANLATLSTAVMTQPVFGPWPSLSSQAAATLWNGIILRTPNTPIVTKQPSGAISYSYQLTGNAYTGANGGTGVFMGLGENITGTKNLVIGDFDNINTSNGCIHFITDSTQIAGVRCSDGVTGTAITFGGSSAATTYLFYPHMVLSGAGGTSDLNVPANNTLHLGLEDLASPTAQTFGIQGVLAGTSNTAGVNLTITGSQGTGTGIGGNILFQVAPAGTSGTAQNPELTAITIAPSAAVTLTTIAGKVDLTGLSLAGQTDILCYNTTGGVVSYDTTVALCTGSDERTKTPIKQLDGKRALDIVLASKPGNFYFLRGTPNDDGDYHFGFGAQTLARVAPELTLSDAQGVPNKVRYSELAPWTWAAMQQMQREIDALRGEIAELRARR